MANVGYQSVQLGEVSTHSCHHGAPFVTRRIATRQQRGNPARISIPCGDQTAAVPELPDFEAGGTKALRSIFLVSRHGLERPVAAVWDAAERLGKGTLESAAQGPPEAPSSRRAGGGQTGTTASRGGRLPRRVRRPIRSDPGGASGVGLSRPRTGSRPWGMRLGYGAYDAARAGGVRGSR
jgi:hypothetical protein